MSTGLVAAILVTFASAGMSTADCLRTPSVVQADQAYRRCVLRAAAMLAGSGETADIAAERAGAICEQPNGELTRSLSACVGPHEAQDVSADVANDARRAAAQRVLVIRTSHALRH